MNGIQTEVGSENGARDRIRTGEPLQEQILSLSPLVGVPHAIDRAWLPSREAR